MPPVAVVPVPTRHMSAVVRKMPAPHEGDYAALTGLQVGQRHDRGLDLAHVRLATGPRRDRSPTRTLGRMAEQRADAARQLRADDVLQFARNVVVLA